MLEFVLNIMKALKIKEILGENGCEGRDLWCDDDDDCLNTKIVNISIKQETMAMNEFL